MSAFIDAIIRLWQDFLDSLNTDGGHILLLALAVTIGPKLGLPEQYRAELIGGLLMYLKTAGSNKTRRDRLIPSTKETVREETEKTTETAPPADPPSDPKP